MLLKLRRIETIRIVFLTATRNVHKCYHQHRCRILDQSHSSILDSHPNTLSLLAQQVEQLLRPCLDFSRRANVHRVALSRL